MIVRFDLHQNVRVVFDKAIRAVLCRVKAFNARAFDNRRIVRIRHHRALRMFGVRGAYHAEQRNVFHLAINHPIGVEDFMAAMLRVGLREHHQLHIRRIAPHTLEVVDQIIDFVFGQGQA